MGRAVTVIRIRRALYGVLVVVTTALLGLRLYDVLATNGLSPLEALTLALSVVLAIGIALSFWTAIFGFWVRLRGGDPLSLTRAGDEGDVDHPLPARTAIVMPVYNEDSARVFAGLAATYASLGETGRLDDFDFFVLSDSTNPELWLEEELGFVRFRQSVSNPARLFYRKRRDNVERKAGNIGDFCAEWGGRYRYMIVLDADSVMTGECLVRLVHLMERNPDAGIVQAPPVPVNRQTLFGRLQQFATRTYGPIFLSGVNFWQAGEGNYWGHNAIIRIAPFVEHCRLPKLPGKEPLGGSILSHDFVEAAFMRRAGFTVHLADELDGSFEESPPTLIDYAVRDRRWVQGNLQHTQLLVAPNLNWVNRLHLLNGVMGYLASPLWMLTLLLATVEAIRQGLVPHRYFSPERTLFPMWQLSIAGKAIPLYVTVMAMLFLPKLMSLVVRLREPRRFRAFGGALKLVSSVFLEALFSVLLAPVMAILHSRFVLSIIFGSNVAWGPQRRGDATTTLGEAVRYHGGTTILGLVWAGITWIYVPEFFAWLTPVLAGFVFAIPLSMLSSRVSVGQWAAERGLFLTPEETSPPSVLRRLASELEIREAERDRVEEALGRLVSDSRAREIHLSLLPQVPDGDPVEDQHFRYLQTKFRLQGPAALSAAEKRHLLFDGESLEALAREASGAGANGGNGRDLPSSIASR